MNHTVETGPSGLTLAKRELIRVPYRANHHPLRISPRRFIATPEIGINCQVGAAALVLGMGYELGEKEEVRSSALLDPNNPRLKQVPSVNHANTGDIILLYAAKRERRGNDGRFAHVGVVSREKSGEIHIADFSSEMEGFAVRKLPEVLDAHSGIVGIVRPVVKSALGPQPEFLQRIGATHLIVQF